MSPPLALDTNAYAEIARGTPQGERLRALVSAERGRLVVLVPVVSELLQRWLDPAYHRQVLATVYEAVPAARRVAPLAADWVATGRLVAALAAAGHDPAELSRRNFYLDLHIAVVCRARGVTLVTADADHARIRPHVGHRLQAFP